MSISVIIPCAGRPAYLRTALRSVANQTAVKEIVEVIVSENSTDRGSREVCADFPELPITYIMRDPPLLAVDHFYDLKTGNLRGTLTAILHDDDWWLPEHLAHALAAFQQEPDAAVYHAGYFNATSESTLLSCADNMPFWFGAGYPPLTPYWKLSRREVIIGSLLVTGGAYSSLVARTEALKVAAFVFNLGNPFDNDRMLTLALTASGPLLYYAPPQICYRLHVGQDSSRYSLAEKRRRMIWTSEWMVSAAGEDWSALGELFADRFEQCPPTARQHTCHVVMEPWCLPLLAKHAGASSRVAKIYKSLLSKKMLSVKKWVKLILPPILPQGWAYLRRKYRL